MHPQSYIPSIIHTLNHMYPLTSLLQQFFRNLWTPSARQRPRLVQGGIWGWGKRRTSYDCVGGLLSIGSWTFTTRYDYLRYWQALISPPNPIPPDLTSFGNVLLALHNTTYNTTWPALLSFLLPLVHPYASNCSSIYIPNNFRGQGAAEDVSKDQQHQVPTSTTNTRMLFNYLSRKHPVDLPLTHPLDLPQTSPLIYH